MEQGTGGLSLALTPTLSRGGEGEGMRLDVSSLHIPLGL